MSMSMAIPPPPPGGDLNRGPAINAVVWTFTSIALLCVILRLYGRLALTRNFGWDDFWIIWSMLLSLTYSCFASVYVHLGGGRYPYYLGLEKTAAAVRMITIGNIAGIISVALPKLAVAVLLIRLLNPTKSQRAILYFLSLSCLIMYILCAVFLWVRCTPVQGLWNPVVFKPKCWSLDSVIDYFLFSGAYSVFVDFYLAIWPMTVLWKLQINRSKKVGLSLVLGLGCIAAIVGIYKCVTLPELRHGTDYTYATEGIEIMSSVEACVIITAACLPTLRPVFLHWTGRSGTTGSGSSSSNKPSKRAEYQLHSFGSDSRGLPGPNGTGTRASKISKKRGQRDPYELDTQLTNTGREYDEENEADSMHRRILPPLNNTADQNPDHPTPLPLSSPKGNTTTNISAHATPMRRTSNGNNGMGGITKMVDVEVEHGGRSSLEAGDTEGYGYQSEHRAQGNGGEQAWERGGRDVY